MLKKRRAAGLNQTELAARSRVSKATISLYEADGIDQPRRGQVDKIAKALGVPVYEARSKAGYAGTLTTPTNAAEFLAALESIGVEGINTMTGIHDLTPDEYRDLLRDVSLAVEMNLRRARKIT